MERDDRSDLTRKRFLAGTTLPVAAAVLAPSGAIAAPSDAAIGPHAVPVLLRINGVVRSLGIEPRVTLLDALREYAQLKGTKKGCDQGTCGACTVLVNGKRINSCLSLAVAHQGDEITTIEGLAHGDELHPVQAAFLENDGFQCGYCTPGQIVSAVGFIAEKRATDDANVREFMSGNICRCGAYPNICAAVKAAANRATV